MGVVFLPGSVHHYPLGPVGLQGLTTALVILAGSEYPVGRSVRRASDASQCEALELGHPAQCAMAYRACSRPHLKPATPLVGAHSCNSWHVTEPRVTGIRDVNAINQPFQFIHCCRLSARRPRMQSNQSIGDYGWHWHVGGTLKGCPK